MSELENEQDSGGIPFDDIRIDLVPENSIKLFDMLISSDLAQYFNRFVQEDFDDEILDFLDPDGRAFWNTITKILNKVGTQLKFRNALKKFQEKKVVQIDEEATCSSKDENLEETEMHYKSFNDHEVRFLFCIFVLKENIFY